ncbi:MAG TPA: Holliday junction branch migration protein RuvA [Clostridia bacterium]|nr:Holliday junction branch migration protein RuvA [Clostridia bacterium]
MYAYIKGKIEETGPDYLIVEANGVGYMIYAPSRVISSVQTGETAKIFTYHHVREDAILLYGFSTAEEKNMFMRLLSVSGIGPKLAMAVLSTLTVEDVALALVSGDAAALTRVPGLGNKTAQRLILELKEKVDDSELSAGFKFVPKGPQDISSPVNEAVHALAALGIPHYEAQRAVRSFDTKGLKAEDIIKKVLQSIDKGR